jgi:hypothetical protein
VQIYCRRIKTLFKYCHINRGLIGEFVTLKLIHTFHRLYVSIPRHGNQWDNTQYQKPKKQGSLKRMAKPRYDYFEVLHDF